MALVIFSVCSTLLMWVRISFMLAMWRSPLLGVGQRRPDALHCRAAQGAGRLNLRHHVGVLGLHLAGKAQREGAHVLQRHVVHQAAGGHIQEDGLAAHRHGVVEGLLEQLQQPAAVVQSLLRGGIQIGGELGEDLQLPEPGQINTQGTGGLLDGPGLGCAAHAGHGQAHVDGGPLSGEEQVGFQVDLAVGDGDNIGGDVGRHVSGLGLDDGQGGHGAAAVLLRQAAGPLQQAGVEIEHVAGVGLPVRESA